MALVIVRHKVKDFAAWKNAFDAHASARGTAGLSNTRLFRSVDDPSEVVILFDTDDIGKAKQFIESPELKLAMAAAGCSPGNSIGTGHAHANGDFQVPDNDRRV